MVMVGNGGIRGALTPEGGQCRVNEVPGSHLRNYCRIISHEVRNSQHH